MLHFGSELESIHRFYDQFILYNSRATFYLCEQTQEQIVATILISSAVCTMNRKPKNRIATRSALNLKLATGSGVNSGRLGNFDDNDLPYMIK